MVQVDVAGDGVIEGLLVTEAEGFLACEEELFGGRGASGDLEGVVELFVVLVLFRGWDICV